MLLEIHKAARLLRAHCARGRVVAMHVALGRDPVGAKRAEGDDRTPEGVYRISGPARPSRFHRFIPIDYPSVRDAREALAVGKITEHDYERIARAYALDRPPPANTPLGGDVGLHGEGARWDGASWDLDWTLGCIAVSDGAIDFLAKRTHVNTPVLILP